MYFYLRSIESGESIVIAMHGLQVLSRQIGPLTMNLLLSIDDHT